MNLLYKAFNNPQKYRNLILKHVSMSPTSPYKGKAFICVSLTRFCPVGCSFCFFSSKQANRQKTIMDAFNEEGINKFVEFANKANLGYLLVSGGGEPFIERKHLLKVVQEIKSDKIVLVTSGNWAKTKVSAENYVMKIYEAFNKRMSDTNLVIRLSVDEEHAKNGLGLDPAHNLLSIFEKKFINHSNFKLQFHTIFEDDYIERFIRTNRENISYIDDYSLRSDADTVLKVNPAEKIIFFKSGLELKIGYAKRFFSDIKVNINEPEIMLRNMAVFSKDLEESEDNNPSVLTNMNGETGLDFWVNFNGNVTTWGNQVPDNIFNLYEDDYQTVVERTFRDPISLAYLEKGDTYRTNIVMEVNSKAVIRSKATNIRDYTGALICEEELTRLYLSLRVIQDYIADGRIKPFEIKYWPNEIQQLLSYDKANLQEAYGKSTYSIVDQYIKKGTFNKYEWLDLFELIKLGHYNLSIDQIKRAVQEYNSKTNELLDYLTLDIKNNPNGFFHEERIIAIKGSVLEKYLSLDNLQSNEILVYS